MRASFSQLVKLQRHYTVNSLASPWSHSGAAVAGTDISSAAARFHSTLHNTFGQSASRLAPFAAGQTSQRSLGFHTAVRNPDEPEYSPALQRMSSSHLTQIASAQPLSSHGAAFSAQQSMPSMYSGPHQEQQTSLLHDARFMAAGQSSAAVLSQNPERRRAEPHAKSERGFHNLGRAYPSPQRHDFSMQRNALAHLWLPRRSSSSSSGAPAEAAVEAANPSPAPSLPQPNSGTVQAPMAVQSVLSPQQVYDKAVEMGEAKANGPFAKTFISAILAGAYVGFGAMLALYIGGNCWDLAASNPGLQKMIFGAFGLPVGLLMVLTCGAELFTSNAAMLPAAVYEQRARFSQLARNWAIAYSGNMLGALMLVGLASTAHVFADATAGPIYYATYKTSHTFLETFGKGILCNWLVCLAVWQATAANTFGGKAIAVWFPISAFVAMGLEHSVANMFIIPMGIMSGADVTVSQFIFNNLIPVTLGNIVAGTTFVAAAYSCVYGSLLKRILGRGGAQRAAQTLRNAAKKP